MIQGFYTAASGLDSHQKKLDVISNNIANSGTTGYKASSVSFKDNLYSEILRPTDGEALMRGSGVRVSAVNRDYSSGTIYETEGNLDFAIQGDGYFAVSDGDKIMYTRDGCFSISTESDGSYLVNKQGLYVLDSENRRISVDRDDFNIYIDGSIGDTGAFIAVYDFANKDGLYHAGGNCFETTAVSGEAVPVESKTVKQGFLEKSNVDFGQEMINMIEAQRAYQLSSRVVKTIDEMEGNANNLRG